MKKLKASAQRYCEIAPGVNMSFCACPEGRFRMGYVHSFIERWLGYQKPLDVFISDGFWISKYMVTQGQWKAIMGSYTIDDAEENQSVFFVSWYDACECKRSTEPLYPLPGNFVYAVRSCPTPTRLPPASSNPTAPGAPATAANTSRRFSPLLKRAA